MPMRAWTRRLLRSVLPSRAEPPPAPPAAAAEPPPPAPPAPAADPSFFSAPSFRASPLPPGAAEALRADHPRLLELKRRYAAVRSPVTDHVSWTERYLRDEVDLHNFRGDNAYVWQLRGLRDWELAEIKYVLTTYYVEKIDHLHLLDRLEEDEAFGAHVFTVNGRTVSRDLLDSILEISFLDRHLGLSRRTGTRVLDVGAGYGRLAHRMVGALPGVARYLCTDAVAESSFISEYYLRYRGVTDRARAVPLDEVSEVLSAEGADLAVNVHSFSECTAAAIGWWLEQLRRGGVRHLLIVPNDGQRLLSRERDGGQVDFRPLVEAAGYRLRAAEPKYLDPSVQRHGVHGSFYYLFERA